MKKNITFFIVITMCLALTACSSQIAEITWGYGDKEDELTNDE